MSINPRDDSIFLLHKCTLSRPVKFNGYTTPVSGEIFWVKHIPGDLWPVNSVYVESFPQLFVSNERLVVGIETELGRVVVVFVGATNVGKISFTPDGSWLTNQKSNMPRAKEKSYDPRIVLSAGDELGIFHLGSTIVTLFEKTYMEKISNPKLVLGPCKVNTSIFGS